MIARTMLERMGLAVDLADDGHMALDRMQHSDYDLVLMDCQMPVLDGYAATIELRKDPRHEALPIIAMTANAMTRDVQQALDAGMNDHIAKPLDIGAMFAVLLKWAPR